MPRKSVFVAMLAVLVFDMLFSSFVNPMGQQDLQTGMPGALMLAVGTSLCAGLAEVDWERYRRSAAYARLICLLGLCSLQVAHRAQDRPTDSFAGMHGRAVLLDLLPDSTLFATGDNVPGQSLYLQSVEGLRRDTLVVVSQHVADENSMRYAYKRAGREFPKGYGEAPGEGSFERVRSLYSNDIKSHPVYWRLAIGAFDKVVRPHLSPGIFVHRMELKPQRRRCHRSPAQSSLSLIPRMGRFEEPTFRTLREFSEYSRMNALWCVLADRPHRGLAFARYAVELSPSSVRALTLLGTLSLTIDPATARSLLERAQAIDPTYTRSSLLLKKYFAD